MDEERRDFLSARKWFHSVLGNWMVSKRMSQRESHVLPLTCRALPNLLSRHFGISQIHCLQAWSDKTSIVARGNVIAAKPA
jgi:hypothetical protein